MTTHRAWIRSIRGFVALVAGGVGGVFLVSGILADPSSGGAVKVISHANSATDWTVYHHDPSGSGVDNSGTSFSPLSAAVGGDDCPSWFWRSINEIVHQNFKAIAAPVQDLKDLGGVVRAAGVDQPPSGIDGLCHGDSRPKRRRAS
jgi:hypothetical protein